MPPTAPTAPTPHARLTHAPSPPPPSAQGGAKLDDENELFVGLLDVFGFENFEVNGFEQLCINFTNEKLQQHFIEAVVKLQQNDYLKEGITCAHIDFPDNNAQIEVIEGRKGMLGVMSMLDEESRIQAGTEENYVEKMHAALGAHELYTKPMPGTKKAGSKGAAGSGAAVSKDAFKVQFQLTHYAGEVLYTATAWLDKNRGVVQPELMGLMMNSSNPLLCECFDAARMDASKDSKGKTLSVGAAFRASLRRLSTTLLQTTARYVRCIKPNYAKRAGQFDGHFVERQLRYTGVGAVIEIQRSGYPISINKADFVTRYRCCCLGTPVDSDVDQASKQVLIATQKASGIAGNWLEELTAQLGKTKIFMRDEVVRALETTRDTMREKAATIIALAMKRKIARLVVKLLRVTAEKCAALRAQLQKGSEAGAEEASATLGEVKQIWMGSKVPTISDSGVRAQRLIGQLEMELHAIEGQIREDKELLAAVRGAIAGKGAEMWFVTLKSAVGAAQEATHGIVQPLKAAIGEANGIIAAEERRVKEEEEAERKREEERKRAAAEAKKAAEEKARVAAEAEAAATKALAEAKDAKAKQAAEEAQAAAKMASAEAAAAKSATEVADKEAMDHLAATAAKIEEFKKWEAEVEKQAKEREAAKKERARLENEKAQVLGEGMERIEIAVRNDPDPEKGMGVQFSMTTITSIVKGGVAAKEGLLHVGDIIEKVDGVPVRGKKILSVIPEKASSVKLVIVRAKDSTPPESSLKAPKEAGNLEGVEMSGWLFKVKAKDGRAVRLPKKRWVVLQGGTLIWYEDSKGEIEANSQTLQGAVCSMPLRSTGYAMTPAMRAFAELHKFPFMLSWPNGEVGHEIVLAASTNPDRSNWVNALIDAIKRTQNDTPTAGWLFKEGGRKTGIALAGWKKRWFVLSPPSKDSPSPQLKYLESPQSKKPKGTIVLKGSDVFVPKKMRGPSGSSYQHCFCVTSTGQQEGQDASGQPMTTCTLLAASSDEDRQKWIHAIRAMMARDQKRESGKGSAVSRATATGIGGDATAAAVEQGNTMNIEQLKKLEPEELMSLRVKQLLAICSSMGIKQAGAAVEKKDLVALIVRSR